MKTKRTPNVETLSGEVRSETTSVFMLRIFNVEADGHGSASSVGRGRDRGRQKGTCQPDRGRVVLRPNSFLSRPLHVRVGLESGVTSTGMGLSWSPDRRFLTGLPIPPRQLCPRPVRHSSDVERVVLTSTDFLGNPTSSLSFFPVLQLPGKTPDLTVTRPDVLHVQWRSDQVSGTLLTEFPCVVLSYLFRRDLEEGSYSGVFLSPTRGAVRSLKR